MANQQLAQLETHPMSAPVPDITNDTVMLTDRSIALLSSQWLYPAADSYRHRYPQPNFRQSFGTLMEEWGRIESPERDENLTGRPRESTNLTPGSSQRLSNQPKNKHGHKCGKHETQSPWLPFWPQWKRMYIILHRLGAPGWSNTSENGSLTQRRKK